MSLHARSTTPVEGYYMNWLKPLEGLQSAFSNRTEVKPNFSILVLHMINNQHKTPLRARLRGETISFHSGTAQNGLNSAIKALWAWICECSPEGNLYSVSPLRLHRALRQSTASESSWVSDGLTCQTRERLSCLSLLLTMWEHACV